jgi:hypothetical protein
MAARAQDRSAGTDPPLHAIVITHTPRALPAALDALGSQNPPPSTIVVSCDVRDEAIGREVRLVAERLGRAIMLVQRERQARSRSAQVRNNAVRALLELGARDDDLLVFLDGDCVMAPGALAAHARLARLGDIVIGFRVDLTPEQSRAFLEPGATGFAGPTPEQRRLLARRHARYERHRLLRALGLVKRHKPKVLSANFAIVLGVFRRVNGFDEAFEGYGGEDDDLGRRVYMAGGRPVIGVAHAVVYHVWHPTRAASRWADSPGIARFRQRLPARCKRGLDNPLEQPEPVVSVVGPMRTSAIAGALPGSA